MDQLIWATKGRGLLASGDRLIRGSNLCAIAQSDSLGDCGWVSALVLALLIVKSTGGPSTVLALNVSRCALT